MGPSRIPTLTESNYIHWAARVKAQLQKKGAWRLVNKGIGESRTDEDMDERAQGVISETLPLRLLYLISDASSAKEMWDTITANFNRKGLPEERRLNREFTTFKMLPGESIMDMIARFNHLKDRLAVLDLQKSDRDIVNTLQDGLSSEYAVFSTALELSQPGIRYQELVSCLLLHEQSQAQ